MCIITYKKHQSKIENVYYIQKNLKKKIFKNLSLGDYYQV